MFYYANLSILKGLFRCTDITCKGLGHCYLLGVLNFIIIIIIDTNRPGGYPRHYAVICSPHLVLTSPISSSCPYIFCRFPVSSSLVVLCLIFALIPCSLFVLFILIVILLYHPLCLSYLSCLWFLVCVLHCAYCLNVLFLPGLLYSTPNCFRCLPIFLSCNCIVLPCPSSACLVCF